MKRLSPPSIGQPNWGTQLAGLLQALIRAVITLLVLVALLIGGVVFLLVDRAMS